MTANKITQSVLVPPQHHTSTPQVSLDPPERWALEGTQASPGQQDPQGQRANEDLEATRVTEARWARAGTARWGRRESQVGGGEAS